MHTLNIIISHLFLFGLLVFGSVYAFPDIWLSWCADVMRWIRRFRISFFGKRIAGRQAIADYWDLYDLGLSEAELLGFDETIYENWDELWHAFGELYAYDLMGSPSFLEGL